MSACGLAVALAIALTRGEDTKPEPDWRPLPLVADGKVAEGWCHVGWGGFVVEDGALRTECSPKGLGLLVGLQNHDPGDVV